MIPKNCVLERIAKYKSQPHPELPKDEAWKRDFLELELRYFKSYGFYTLEQALGNFPLLYLSHNGMVEIGLCFDEVVSSLKLHPNPSEIPIMTRAVFEGGPTFNEKKLSTGLEGSEHSFVKDNNPEISPHHADLRFFEGFFGLDYTTFRSTIVEPGYGLRLDIHGQLGKFLEKVVSRHIPLFIHTADIDGSNKKDSFYIVNGFNI